MNSHIGIHIHIRIARVKTKTIQPKKDKFMIHVEVSSQIRKGEAEKLDLSTIFKRFMGKKQGRKLRRETRKSRLSIVMTTRLNASSNVPIIKEFGRCKSG